MKKCYYCGVELEDDADFCTECGSELPNCTCPRCGADVDEHDNFCQNCGYDLLNDEGVEVEDESDEEVSEAIEEAENSTRSKYLIPIMVGVIALALIGGWYFWRSHNATSADEMISADSNAKIEEVVDSIPEVVETNDVHSEEFIKQRLEEICTAFNDPEVTEEKMIDRFFSSEFRKMYNTIGMLEQNGKGTDGLWYSGGFFDGSSETVDKMSVGQIISINENEANADYIYYNGDFKFNQTVKLVLEEENWYIDDICNRKSDMKEYIDSMVNDEKTADETTDTIPEVTEY